MNKKKLAWQLPFLAILIIGTIIILKKQAPFRTDEGFVFGTVYKITYQSEDNLKEEIETELKKVDNSLSPFNPNSVITRVNHNEKTEVDSFFVHVFHLSKKISDETHGAFDITVAPLVNAWGFGFKKSTGVDSLLSLYTHLRAHETKANLVCRLLLEKKKNKTTVNYTAKSNNIYKLQTKETRS